MASAAFSLVPPSLSTPPPLSCSLCQMFSYSSASFSEVGRCNKCSIFVALEARVSELEARLRAVEQPGPAVASAESTRTGPSRPSTAPVQPAPQASWVTVRRKPSARPQSAANLQPLSLNNRFAPLSDAPAEQERPILVIGSSIVRNVAPETRKTTVKCLPGARAADIRSHLKLLA